MTDLITKPTPPRARNRLNGEAATAERGHLELRLWLRMISCSMKMESILGQRLRKEFSTSMARFKIRENATSNYFNHAQSQSRRECRL